MDKRYPLISLLVQHGSILSLSNMTLETHSTSVAVVEGSADRSDSASSSVGGLPETWPVH